MRRRMENDGLGGKDAAGPGNSDGKSAREKGWRGGWGTVGLPWTIRFAFAGANFSCLRFSLNHDLLQYTEQFALRHDRISFADQGDLQGNLTSLRAVAIERAAQAPLPVVLRSHESRRNPVGVGATVVKGEKQVKRSLPVDNCVNLVRQL